MRDLNNILVLNPLYPDKRLYRLAEVHARKMGEKGKTGHARRYSYTPLDIIKRAHRDISMGENCSYGYSHAIDIVMQLLFDSGVKSLGHRKNILHKRYHFIGTSIMPHKKYDWNCVMDFK